MARRAKNGLVVKHIILQLSQEDWELLDNSWRNFKALQNRKIPKGLFVGELLATAARFLNAELAIDLRHED